MGCSWLASLASRWFTDRPKTRLYCLLEHGRKEGTRGENGSDTSENENKDKGGTNEKKKEAGEEKTGRREAAGSHGTLEMDAGQSKRFLQKK